MYEKKVRKALEKCMGKRLIKKDGTFKVLKRDSVGYVIANTCKSSVNIFTFML